MKTVLINYNQYPLWCNSLYKVTKFACSLRNSDTGLTTIVLTDPSKPNSNFVG